MARNNMSYFAEERSRNNNPNFFNNMKLQDLKNKVKRIVKDIKNQNIIDTDLIYFTNNNVLSALLEVSYVNWTTNLTILNGMNYYFNNALIYEVTPPGNSLRQEKVNTSNIITTATNKAMLWRTCYEAFENIRMGYDIKQCIEPIVYLDKSLFYNL